MNKSTKRVALGAIFAAVAGYIAGILTAPKSGKETREDIKHAAEVTISQAEKQLKKMHTELATLIGEARDKATLAKGKALKELNEVIGRTQTVKEKAREVLSAIHEGDADDKELQKALKEAEKAIEHLKSFLAK